MKRRPAILVLLIVLAIPLYLVLSRATPSPASASPDLPSAASASIGLATVALAVSGMTCATCPITVKEALQRVSGVTKVEVTLAAEEAVVTYDPSRTTVAALTQATTNAGYPSQVR